MPDAAGGDPTAVDDQVVTGDVGGFVGEQEQGGVHHVLGHADPADQQLFFVPGTQPLVRAGTEDSCDRGSVDQPGGYRVDPDAQWTELDRAYLRQPNDGGLRRAVDGQQG